MHEERRQFRRAEQIVNVRFGTKDEFITAVSRNIGDGGLFLITTQFLDVGQCFLLEFNLPDSDYCIAAEAEVRWIRKRGDSFDGMGLSFSKMSRGNFLKIVTYLDSLGLPPSSITPLG